MQKIRVSLLALFSMVTLISKAQIRLVDDGKVQVVLAQNETFHDFIVPDVDSLNMLILEAEGGDGGWIEYTYIDRFNSSRTQRVNAGSGTTVSANYRIGSKPGDIPPGSILRMIIGKRGQWAKYDLLSDGNFGAGGGGGTAILLSKDSGANWQILLVAAGGGGAGVQKVDGETNYHPGEPGLSSEYANNGDLVQNTAQGGSYGSGGSSVGLSGGGGGAFSDGLHDKYNLNYGNAGWKDHKMFGQPLGGLGGTETGARNGGWGFGGGGSGFESGGGGGGYSGGGAGLPGFGGGGGGSFVDTISISAMHYSKKTNDETNNPGDGYVRYLFGTNTK